MKTYYLFTGSYEQNFKGKRGGEANMKRLKIKASKTLQSWL